MTVEQIDGTRLLIALCDEDMKKLSLNYDTLSLGDPHSSRTIKRLLLLAGIKTGIDIQGKKITIEAMELEGGCLLLVSVAAREKPPRHYTVRKKPYFYIAGFDCADELLRCAGQLKKERVYIPPSDLYLYHGKYYLVFTSKIHLRKRLRHLLSEFCSSLTADTLFCSRLREYGKPICLSSALHEIMSGL